MVDEKGFLFGLIFIGIIIFGIIMAIIVSITKVKESIKESKGVNPINILLIVLCITFIFQNIIHEIGISLIFSIIGIIGNIYNHKQKGKYYRLGIFIYTLMIVYGIFFLVYNI